MGREVLTTQKQNFWKEAYLKEALIRLNWYRQHSQACKARGPRRAKQKPREKLKLPAINEALLKAAEEKKKAEAAQERIKQLEARGEEKEEEEGAAADKEPLPDFDMKPVTPRTRSLLYSGISKEEEGRYRYLHQRLQLKPDDKYMHPLSTNWTYGWQLGKVDPGQRSIYPRCNLVRDTFFRRNGALSLLDPHDTASC
ncbi:protein ATP6V1FNB [Rhinatrema bivittatum]|uniref:protein ATP6V1FNB n=1 Tax=Rhinatrema bivittatum TaxID=194408 RepID=UPI00112B761E|nr:protein ATP6V1FNB [Rhinatrema bivittatum]